MVTPWHAVFANHLQGGRRPFREMEDFIFRASAGSGVRGFLGRMAPPHTVPMGMSSLSLLQIGVLSPGDWLAPGRGPIATRDGCEAHLGSGT